MNVSNLSIQETARTSVACATQRAENLQLLGVNTVLELCVGPSLITLDMIYDYHDIIAYGNDIDPRYQKYYPDGRWIVGDARYISTKGYDAVVVAPPLSKGCSGRREDALSLNDVTPSYYDFVALPNRVVVYTLPGKTLSIKEDRDQFHKFLKVLHKYSRKVDVVPLTDKVTKYVDVYTERM